MSIELALGVVILLSLIGNRILSLLVGLLLRIPAHLLLPTVYLMDVIQIPFFYWIYENGSTLIAHLPASIRGWFNKDWRVTSMSRWTTRLGSLGVFVVAAMPTFGGGMWSAVFLAYGLRLRKTWSYFLIGLGSLLSYLSLFWVLDTLVRTFRYFSSR